MNFKYFIGIDVSKNVLDWAVVKDNQQLLHFQSLNSVKGIETFIKNLKKELGLDWHEVLFCMEHTGIYNNHLLEYFEKRKANVVVESALHIKQSSGMQRGKNDKIDAQRIAAYAYRHKDELKLWKPQRKVIKQLKHLSKLRNRLIGVIGQLKKPLKEGSEFEDKDLIKQVAKLCKSSLVTLENDLKKIDKQIKETLQSDEYLKNLFNLITSVDGIGKVTAAAIIIYTDEFKKIQEARKLSCYAGVVPFEHSSGKSIRGKTRVSKMANKNLKQLLHMAAMSVISKKGELRNYYERKVATGKNKMSVLNAIRNKLILRIYAVVRENRKYEKNYAYPLA